MARNTVEDVRLIFTIMVYSALAVECSKEEHHLPRVAKRGLEGGCYLTGYETQSWSSNNNNNDRS